MHTLQKKDREQNPQPRCFCTSRRISLKSQLSGTECSPQPCRHGKEQRGGNKIGAGRKAGKLRITAPGAIIVRVTGLHLERSQCFGSRVVLGVRICTKRQLAGREGAPTHSSISIQAHSKGTANRIIPDLPGESHHQLQGMPPSLMGLCLHTLPCSQRWGPKHSSESQIQRFLYLIKQELGEDLLTECFAAN